MRKEILGSAALLLIAASAALAQDSRDVTWRYYRPGNTGIQGDYCDAIWIGPDGDPWIGGYDPGFGHPGLTGTPAGVYCYDLSTAVGRSTRRTVGIR
jgi:hypothetical protein